MVSFIISFKNLFYVKKIFKMSVIDLIKVKIKMDLKLLYLFWFLIVEYFMWIMIYCKGISILLLCWGYIKSRNIYEISM